MAPETPPKSSRSERTLPLPASTELALIGTAEAAEYVHQFPYMTTGDSTSAGDKIVRPTLGVHLLDHVGNRLAQARAIVDSGADQTTLSHEWAEVLGIDLEKDCAPVKASVAGEKMEIHWAYTEGLWVEVLGESLFLPVAMFCKKLPVTLLGRRDFFDRYLVLFDDRRRRFFLERRPDLVEGGPEAEAARAAHSTRRAGHRDVPVAGSQADK
jgi:hypothetical protein